MQVCNFTCLYIHHLYYNITYIPPHSSNTIPLHILYMYMHVLLCNQNTCHIFHPAHKWNERLNMFIITRPIRMTTTQGRNCSEHGSEVRVCMHVCMCMCVCVRVHVCVCMCVCVCTCNPHNQICSVFSVIYTCDMVVCKQLIVEPANTPLLPKDQHKLHCLLC